MQIIKDEVLIAVGCPIFPSILIAKYLFTGSLKNKSIDAKVIYFNEKFLILLIIYSKNRNKLEIKF
jgi:hypothetical protein